MKSRPAVLALAATAGIIAWVINALVESVVLHDGSLVGRLILDVPPAQLAARIATVLLFLGLGWLLSEPAPPVATDEEDKPRTVDLQTEHFAYDAHVMILGLDVEGRITFFNRRCEEVIGHSRREVVGQSFFDALVPPRSLPTMLPAFRSVVQGGATVDKEASWLAHGREAVIAAHFSPVRDERGDIIGAVAVAEEVTEFRLSEQDLLQSREPFRPLTETMMGDGLAALDGEGRVTWASASLAEMLERERGKLTGARLAEVMAEEEREPLRQALARCAADGERVTVETTITTQSGRRFPAAITAMALQSDAASAGALVLLRDLTDIKRGELEMAAAREGVQAELQRMTGQLRDVEGRVAQAGEEARAESAAELARLTGELAAAEVRLEEARGAAQAEAQVRIDELQAQLADAQARADGARQAAQAEAQARIDELEAQLAAADTRAEEAREAVEAESA